MKYIVNTEMKNVNGCNNHSEHDCCALQNYQLIPALKISRLCKSGTEARAAQ